MDSVKRSILRISGMLFIIFGSLSIFNCLREVYKSPTTYFWIINALAVLFTGIAIFSFKEYARKPAILFNGLLFIGAIVFGFSGFNYFGLNSILFFIPCILFSLFFLRLLLRSKEEFE